jgi:hypothetical protein
MSYASVYKTLRKFGFFFEKLHCLMRRIPSNKLPGVNGNGRDRLRNADDIA